MILRETFPEAFIPMTFLELNQGGIIGNTVKARYDFEGILKEVKGMTLNQNMELLESNSRVHIEEDESFMPTLKASFGIEGFRGHGLEVTVGGVTSTYRIIGYPVGVDYDEGEAVFNWFTLKQESLAEYTDGS